MSAGAWAVAAALAVAGLTAAGCATSPAVDAASGGQVLQVAASINAWGSILEQLGGTRVHATSIVTNPSTDPHGYEPTPLDATVIAKSRLFVENGIGYDAWAAKSLAASPDSHRRVIDVGRLVHVGAGGNPHRWYSPDDVTTVADAITADLKQLDPAGAGYYDQQRRRFATSGLARYDALVRQIRSRYAGVPVGASESIFTPLARSLRLDLVTPASLLKAVSEGTDPSTADLATVHAQLTGRKVRVFVFNRQNATPDVTAEVAAARKAGIPVTTVTETLSPAGVTFQEWQATQLEALAAALHRATGR